VLVNICFTRGREPLSYRGALLSTLLHASVHALHSLLNVLVQIANKMGLQKISIWELSSYLTEYTIWVTDFWSYYLPCLFELMLSQLNYLIQWFYLTLVSDWLYVWRNFCLSRLLAHMVRIWVIGWLRYWLYIWFTFCPSDAFWLREFCLFACLGYYWSNSPTDTNDVCLTDWLSYWHCMLDWLTDWCSISLNIGWVYHEAIPR
jgi:hypothetical protein